MSVGICRVGLFCFLFCCLTAASALRIPDKRSEYGVPLSTFKLKRISHELSSDEGHRIQLFLEGASLPEVYLADYTSVFQLRPLQLQDDGHVEFSQRSYMVHVLFLHPQGYQLLRLDLLGLGNVEQDVPDMELFVQGGKEVTFEPGSNADVDVTFTVDDDEGKTKSINLMHSFSMRSRTEDHVVRTFSNTDEGPVEVIAQDSSWSSRASMHLRVMTSSGDVAGVLEVEGSVHFDCSGSGQNQPCLQGYYSIHEDVPVYQSGDDGPFPEHFIGFMKYALDERTPESRKTCSIHDHSCRLGCEFIGDHPSRVEFVRVNGIPGLGSPSGFMSVSNKGFRAMGYLVFENVTKVGEAEYQCRSTSGSEIVTHTARIVFVNGARIIDDQSTVTKLDDGTVEATCVAEGTPVPTLSLYDSNFVPLNDANPGSYQLVTTPGESTSKAVLRIKDPAVASSMDYVICSAFNEAGGVHFSRTGYLHVQTASKQPSTIQYYLERVATPA